MSSRIHRKLSLVLVAVLVGAGAVGAPAASAAEIPPASFVDGAMHVGGLSRSSAIRAWSDGRRNSIGVFVEETQSVSQSSPATHDQLMRLSAATPLSMVATAKVKQNQYGAMGGVANRKHVSERHAKFSDAWGTPTQIAINQEGRYDGGTSQSGRII